MATAGGDVPAAAVRAIIFDCDGTLVDTETPYRDAYHDALAETYCGAGEPPTLSPKTWGMECSGRGLERCAQYAVESFQLTCNAGDFLALWKRLFAARIAEPRSIELLEGFDELHAAARAAGYRVAVASSSDRPGLRLKLTNGVIAHSHTVTSLEAAFDAIVCNDDVTRHKPDPEMYLLTASRLGAAPEACWVVEDSETGVLAGKRAGMRVAAVPNMYTKLSSDFSRADTVVNSMREIVALL
eukprot:NODE_15040_length_1071_cov_11.237288.p1 GENE.NODE_15040_length_1071_cov_11.237288~~NODE_15040_length_1071_cov_11.237288.p1  ORF type:complete len:242 (+),score=73.22 NODE_15040_length_1071_cov_11.237288:120-845(+)